MKYYYTTILILLSFISFSQECSDNEYQVYIETTTGEWGYEMSWELWDYNSWESSGDPIISFQGGDDYEETIFEECIPDTGCLMIIAYDSYGDGWNGGYMNVSVNAADEMNYELDDGNYSYWFFEVNTDPCTWEIPGCTDSEAINYNEFATIDDGSCLIPFIYDWDKTEREYYLYMPDGGLPENSPLLFVLHGYYGSGNYWLDVFKELADEYKFMVCAPNGLPDNYKINHWNANFNNIMTSVDDLGFLSNLALSLQNEYGLNPNKTFACGMSNGGYMSWSLAKHAPDVFSAIASVTGTMSGPDWNDEFNTSPLIPVMQISGTNDNIVPMDGSMQDDGEGWAGAPDINDIMNFWSEQHNCENSMTETIEFDYTTDITYYNTCENNAELRLYIANQMGHTWPEFAASEIWDFFMQVEEPSWNCINNSCIKMIDGSGEYASEESCATECNTTTITEPNKDNKKLKKVTNLLGQETSIRKNTPMFYIYDDGSVNKKIIIE